MDIFLIDDSVILRQRLRRLIGTTPDINICGEAGTIEESIELLKRLKPDLIVLDIQLVNGLGFDVYDRVVSKSYRPHWIVLTNYPTAQYKQMCAERQIKYFFDKTEDLDKIVSTIKKVNANMPK